MRLISLVADLKEIDNAKNYLADLMILARIPPGYFIRVEQTNFLEFVEQAPRADLNIFGLTKPVDKSFTEKMVKINESTCLFVKDSGFESVVV